MRERERGSVLVYVLVTALVVSVIAAGLTRMILNRYYAVEREASGVRNRKLAESGFDRLSAYWNTAGAGNSNNVCAAPPAGIGYSCSGTTSGCSCDSGASVSCDCVCSPSDPGDATVRVDAGSGGICVVTVTTPP